MNFIDLKKALKAGNSKFFDRSHTRHDLRKRLVDRKDGCFLIVESKTHPEMPVQCRLWLFNAVKLRMDYVCDGTWDQLNALVDNDDLVSILESVTLETVRNVVATIRTELTTDTQTYCRLLADVYGFVTGLNPLTTAESIQEISKQYRDGLQKAAQDRHAKPNFRQRMFWLLDRWPLVSKYNGEQRLQGHPAPPSGVERN